MQAVGQPTPVPASVRGAFAFEHLAGRAHGRVALFGRPRNEGGVHTGGNDVVVRDAPVEESRLTRASVGVAEKGSVVGLDPIEKAIQLLMAAEPLDPKGRHERVVGKDHVSALLSGIEAPSVAVVVLRRIPRIVVIVEDAFRTLCLGENKAPAALVQGLRVAIFADRGVVGKRFEAHQRDVGPD